MDSPETKNGTCIPRTIALFPGAFQPPHEAHLAAARHLAGREDVDEVVIIIANRCRGIPGTALSLDANISERIWRIYLREQPRTRVEVALHSAVGHALGYLDRARPGDRLLYCIGEEDLAKGDPRFATLDEQARARGLRAEIVCAPTAAITVRATALRACIARGDAGRTDFLAGLPASLDEAQRLAVWQACSDGLRCVADIVAEKLALLLEGCELGHIAEIRCLDRNSIDPAFHLFLRSGECLFARYAGDAVETADPVAGLERKPRRRLKVERRAIERLCSDGPFGLELPAVRHYQRKQGVLVLDGLLIAGRTLAASLRCGQPGARALSEAARFLAQLHHRQPAPFRDADADDVAQWQQRLALTTTHDDAVCAEPLAALRCASARAARPAFMHLNAGTGSFRIDGERMGVVDFEHCGNFGDPALDLGRLLGDCLGDCLASGHAAVAADAAERALAAYLSVAGARAADVCSRVLGFTGACLLRHAGGHESDACTRVARRLLAGGPAASSDLAGTLRAALPSCA